MYIIGHCRFACPLQMESSAATITAASTTGNLVHLEEYVDST